jgi:hypothetical protein
MERIKRASVADCEALLQWLSSNALVEKEGSLYVMQHSLPLLAQFGIETCTSPTAGPGMYWINRADLFEAFTNASRIVKDQTYQTAAV